MLYTIKYEELVKYYNDKHSIKECAKEFNMTEYEVTGTLMHYAAHFGYVRRYSEQRAKWGIGPVYPGIEES